MQSQNSTYVSLVDRHWPASTYTRVAVLAETHPECPSPLFAIGPVSWRGQALLDIQSGPVQSVQTHHKGKSSRSSSTHPGARKERHPEFVHGDKKPTLDVRKSDDAFTMTAHLIALNVLSGALVEMILQFFVLVVSYSGESPHGVAKTYWWS